MNKKIVFILVGILVCIAIIFGIVLDSKGNKENSNTENNDTNSDVSVKLNESMEQYDEIKKNAKVLTCTRKDAYGVYVKKEYLYDSNEENILGVYYKYIGMDDMNAENRKTEIETNLTQKGYDYDAKIVDEHLEYEYIITKEDVLRSAGYLGKDNTLYNNKMIAEEIDQFTCKVTDNTK